MLKAVILPVVVLAAIGLTLGLIIGLVVRLFAVKPDPRQEETEGLLPGLNCGACGYAGCAAFAEALLEGEAEPVECPVSDQERVDQLCGLLGLTGSQREPRVAVVRCGGDRDRAAFRAAYNGVIDCRDAELAGGAGKGCRYGCLGLGSCARVCPFGAIEITSRGLAVVHPDICTGCGKCVPVCPRAIIEMVPRSAPLHVFCNSPEKGAVSRKVCDVSCIACRKCVKAAESEGQGEMIMDGALARVNYENPPSAAICEVCPTGCLQPAGAVLSEQRTDSDEPAGKEAEEMVAHG